MGGDFWPLLSHVIKKTIAIRSARKEISTIGSHVHFTEKPLNFTEINPRSVYFYEKDPKLSTNRRAVQNFAKKKRESPPSSCCDRLLVVVAEPPSRRAAVPPTGPPRRDAAEKET